MGKGKPCGTYGDGASNSWKSGCPTAPIDIAPNAQGQYVITYSYWVDFLGIPAYRVYINGIDPAPGYGWQLNSVSWVVTELDTAQKFDCLNGQCVPATSYNTGGFYANLAACESGCAKNSNCNGECLDSERSAALDRAVAEAVARIACK